MLSEARRLQLAWLLPTTRLQIERLIRLRELLRRGGGHAASLGEQLEVSDPDGGGGADGAGGGGAGALPTRVARSP
jgi:hypothetical protein